jgi:hypothetical protein
VRAEALQGVDAAKDDAAKTDAEAKRNAASGAAAETPARGGILSQLARAGIGRT